MSLKIFILCNALERKITSGLTGFYDKQYDTNLSLLSCL